MKVLYPSAHVNKIIYSTMFKNQNEQYEIDNYEMTY